MPWMAVSGRAQLVRELGGQPLLGPDRAGDAVEQPVEGGPEGGELVDRRAEAEAVAQVVLAPVLGPLGHLRHGRQRRGSRPSG